MELDWLETFLAVVDRGGFTAASEHVHRSQSRVSAHIAGLERELGVRLIDRTRRPATVTPAGQVLARHAREIVAGVGSARSAVGALRAMDSESLSVLTTPCIGGSLLPGVVAELADRHPGVRITLTEQSRDEVERSFPADGVAVAVLPTLPHPLRPRPAGAAAVAGADPAGGQPGPRAGPAGQARPGRRAGALPADRVRHRGRARGAPAAGRARATR